MMFRRIILSWLPIAFTISTMSGLGYLLVQQDVRQTTYDEPQRLAQDVANKLVAGTPVAALQLTQTVNIADSLSPYVVVYTANGQPVAGTGLLDNTLPTPPAGVFDYSTAHGEDRLTWQPRPDVRSAIVMIAIHGNTPGYVLAGQSLVMTETHTLAFLKLAAIGWLVALIGSFFLVGIREVSLAELQPHRTK